MLQLYFSCTVPLLCCAVHVCVFIATHHFHKSQLVQCVQCVCCVGVSDRGPSHGEYLTTKEWKDSMTTKIPKHAQRIPIILLACVVVSHPGECEWVYRKLKQYYCLKSLVLQAKNEVADLREVMDNWHNHCQVSNKVHDMVWIPSSPLYVHEHAIHNSC